MGDFGAKLRQARERRGVSLQRVSAATKISVAALDALERNDLSKLPGGIFSRAFVRSYAIEVGLDPDETVRDFVAEFSTETGGASRAAPAHTPGKAASAVSVGSTGSTRSAAVSSERPRRVPPTPLVAAPDESEFESQQRMATVALRLVVMSIPIVFVILYLSSRAGGPSTPAFKAERSSAPPPAAEAPIPSSGEGAPPSPVPSQPAQTAGGSQTIELQPTGPCWVSLTVDGAPTLTRTLQPGERELRRFREQAVLIVGDGAACRFTLNGQPARPLAGEGRARTARITPENLASYLR